MSAEDVQAPESAEDIVETRYSRRHVYFCRKRCNFGTDDIFFPALVSVAVRATWFLFALAVCIYLYVHPSCSAISIPIIFAVSIIGFVVLQGVIVLVDIALVAVSSLGDISYSKPREKIDYVIYLRMAVFVVEIAWDIFSTYVVVDSQINSQISCASYMNAETIYTVIVIVNWAALGILGALFCIFLDPLGLCCVSSLTHVHKKQVDENDPEAANTTGVYRNKLTPGLIAHRVKAVFCPCLRKQGVSNKRLALNDAAKALGAIMCDFDATFTDKVSAFILAAYFQKGLRNAGYDPGDELRRATVSLLQQTDCVGVDYNTARPIPVYEKTEELENVRYYLKFAMAAYGWPIQVVLKPCSGPISLCIAARGCCCCPRCQFHQFDGDKCFPNAAAIEGIAEVPQENILDASFLNNVFETPFYAVEDPDAKEVVIAIRGTLSLNDVLTDVAISMVEVPEGYLGIEGCYVHSGFLNSAEQIYGRLAGNRTFKRLLNKEGYKMVIVGHSLGAGVAAVLAVLFKDRCPEWSEELVAYTYSTPGAVMDYRLAMKCRDFVISVVMGFDIVPRMTMRSMAYLKMMLERLLDTVPLKKQELCCCVGCKWWTPDLPLDEELCKLLEYQDPNDPLGSIANSLEPESYTKLKSFLPFTVKGRRNQDYQDRKLCLKQFLQRLDVLHGGAKEAREQQPMMFIPGRILHIEETKEFFEKKCCGLQQVNKIKASWKAQETFSTVLVHSDMLLDHTPGRSVTLMNLFVDQILDPDDTSETKVLADKTRSPPPNVSDNQSSDTLEQGLTPVTLETKHEAWPSQIPVEVEMHTTVFTEEIVTDNEVDRPSDPQESITL